MNSEILAQVNWEQVGVIAGVFVAAMGGREGVAKGLSILADRRARNGNPGKHRPEDEHVREGMCALRHQELEKRQEERHEVILKGLDGVREDIRGVQNRIDQIQR